MMRVKQAGEVRYQVEEMEERPVEEVFHVRWDLESNQ